MFKPFYLLLVFLCVAAAGKSQGISIDYKQDTAQLEGYSVTAKSKVPGILILPAWMGITKHEITTANRLGKLGYNAFVADIYGKNRRPKTAGEAGKLAGFYKQNHALYQERIKAALDALVQQGADPQRIVIIGYCFGGTGALEAARAGFTAKGIVTFHGGLGKDKSRSNGPLPYHFLILHGADDPHESEAEIRDFQQELRDGKADWQMVYFSGAVHSFTDPGAGSDNSKGSAYNKLADERSWRYFIQFLKEIF